ncbi:hypothetical protein BKG76_21710 [Mycobacteroides franklinii]|uniref:Outer membrane channel protein CpnT-like N-terminal domain-containing protein n=1 Tax=Mycobacteroides franklinii TaxID=948102 RepID=A0A1S1L0B8_9MYCO|nr:WXG100 family type VII secretion target [Mycobacteroides franklinii]NGX08017.1 hypothetical protein [Mycobacteroides franklinii]OHU19102.1 hypothetical protein BKG76_21710 [Mycobacteroides franklinii]
MNPGLNVNPEELKKLAEHLNGTVTEFNATAGHLTQLAGELPRLLQGKAGDAARAAMGEFVTALSELGAEEQRIAEKVSDFAKTFASGESLRATAITQTRNG